MKKNPYVVNINWEKYMLRVSCDRDVIGCVRVDDGRSDIRGDVNVIVYVVPKFALKWGRPG